jgi:hypothetical protein
VGADCTYVRFADVERTMPVTGRNNSFAVVAKDNAGAIERVLVEGQNWCCFDPLPGTEMKIVINGGILGTRNNKAGGGPANVQSVSEVFRGVEVGFRWEGDATGYGANVVGFRYAVEDTTEWTAWYSGNTRYPESGEEFVPSVGNHVLYVEGLDDLGTVSLCYFKYYVEPGPRIGESYPLLIVDDSQYSGQSNSYGSWVAYLADQTEEDFFERVFEGYPYTEFDCRAQGREPPPVSLVGRYRTVFWYYDDNNGIGGELKPIFQLGTRFLDSYVGVGGNMILSGQQPALALDPDCRPNYAYPFRYDDLYCQENQTVPFSFSRMGLKGLFIDGQERFKGAISTDPDFPSLPIGAIWPFVSAQDTMWLWEVEAFNPGDVNTRVNARAIYDYDYFIAAGEDSETVMSWRHCALIVDNATNPQVGSTAYFGWPLIWCDWDSVAAFMREFLTDVCNEPPTSR